MQALLNVILPVFLVMGFGYVAAWQKLFSDSSVDGLMKFSQNFAFPSLLFLAMAKLDLAATFDPALVVSFYGGAITGFVVGFFGARLLFRRPLPDCIAIGFCCLFSNSLLLGVPITERAFGVEALKSNYILIALHAPVCYAIGLTVMELARAEGAGFRCKARSILRTMFRNSFILGIVLGVAFNLSGLPIPGIFQDALDLIVRAAVPAALFALGGVLYRYRPEGDAMTIAMICAVSLVVHPAITWGLGKALGLTTEQFRSAVVTAAMAPGVNTYLFANLYGVARRVVASAVLIATATSILTVWVWLSILP